FILVGGNLSGIQKYIFGITRNSGKGVSKIFRARSFYLQALIRAALIDIQRTTGLLGACRLLDSGGKFILLLPDTEDIRRKIEQFDRELQIWFRDKFKGTVTLSLSWHTRLKHQDFMLESFRFQIDRLNETLEAVKYQKLCKTFSEQGMVIEEGYEQTEAGNCTLCGINSADPESIKHYSQKTESEIAICRDCSDQILYFGSKLPRTRYLVYGTTEKAPVYRDIRITLSADPPPVIDNDILHVEALVDKPGFGRYRLARHLPTLLENDLADENWFRVFEQDLDFERTDGQSVPMTFNMIAHKSKKRIPDKLVGRSLLGFMKADVDNLGLIFGLGLGDRLSVARFTMMSRMLHIFFSEYLVELLKKEFPYIYVVFAGGDDLFLVGPWWQTVDFAITLREHFSMFCAENPDITLSCGLLPARPRLPMKRAVELVETYLENAKSHDSRSRRKDSICFMGETVSWVEMKELMALGRQFDQAVEQKSRTKFSTAFLYRLMEYHKMYRRFIEGGEIKSGRYLSLAHYDIGRNIISGNKDNQAELDMLFRIFSVGVDERPELNRLNIPLFYAINMNRES
ncbi:MAG: type III-A CRISPR-associated protein Cas10/Csm1, partial [Thermodesulfobacteriota bacterium]|nr:type III-A CRISPR-associated protein Cas10/Csm1 [Thermodesulfobacteriota bacterium]